MTARFTAGEVVDITVRGARVTVTKDKRLQVSYGVPYSFGTGGYLDLNLTDGNGVTVARVAPAEWPPVAGDIWADRDGEEWAAVARGGDPDRVELMYLADDSGGYQAPNNIAADLGPMRLAYRSGWTPVTAEPETDGAGEVDERAAGIAGLRALADFLETHPDIPLPNDMVMQYSVLHWMSPFGRRSEAERIAEAQRVAGLLGVELDDHLTADRDFGGEVIYRVHTYRDAKPAIPAPALPSDDELHDAHPAVTAAHDGFAVGRAAGQ